MSRFKSAASVAVIAASTPSVAPAPLIRFEKAGATGSSVPRGIDHRSLALLETEEGLETSGAAARLEHGSAAVPICDGSTVLDTCRRLRRFSNDERPKLTASLGQINQALGLCASLGTVDWLMDNLGLQADLVEGPHPGRANMRVGCARLCEATLRFFQKRSDKYAMPTSSDTTCWREGNDMHCDIDVSPRTVSKEAGRTRNFGSEDDDRQPPRNTAMNAGNGLANENVKDSNCPFEKEAAALRIAQIFRFYPRKKNNDFVDTPSASEKRIYVALAKAEAWLSLTLRAMINFETLDQIDYFFGSPGTFSTFEVRAIVWRVLSYVLRAYQDGLHIVVNGRGCGQDIQGYVWQNPEETGDVVRPNKFGCSPDSPTFGECGIDAKDGRYRVYICQYAFSLHKGDFVSLFVHEVVHHAGPMDLSYSPQELHSMPQAHQLGNADNYQRFLVAVARLATKFITTTMASRWQ